MTRTKKRAVLILSILLVLLGAELGREYLSYRMALNRLEGSYWKLHGRTNLTKEEVRAMVGEPSRIESGAGEENWYWYAHEARGPLWRLITPARGYELNAQFDKSGRMIDVYSKVN
jgi:hypothetical protein